MQVVMKISDHMLTLIFHKVVLLKQILIQDRLKINLKNGYKV